MREHLLLTCLAVAILLGPGEVRAQFTDPRTYTNVPTGTNQIELGYSYARGNASIDTALVIPGAKFSLNQGIIDYTRNFGLLHRLMWAEASVPVAGLSGSIVGTNIQGTTIGAGDSSYQWGILLKGGPALNTAQFNSYTPVTTLGISLTAAAPTGSYKSDKILNLGADRWAFKTEIALSHPFGTEQRWEFDVYANAFFYTDNTSFHGTQILSQEPVPGLEGHISYSFSEGVWMSLDTRYSFRGTTFEDGIDQNDAQHNFIVGSELNVSLNSQNSLTFEFAKAAIHHNSPAVAGFSIKYDHTW